MAQKKTTARAASTKAPSSTTVKKAEAVLLSRALAKSLSPKEIRAVLETEGFNTSVIEHIISRADSVMKKYSVVATKRAPVK